MVKLAEVPLTAQLGYIDFISSSNTASTLPEGGLPPEARAACGLPAPACHMWLSHPVLQHPS